MLSPRNELSLHSFGSEEGFQASGHLSVNHPCEKLSRACPSHGPLFMPIGKPQGFPALS